MALVYVQKIFDLTLGQYVVYEGLIPTASPLSSTTTPTSSGNYDSSRHFITSSYDDPSQGGGGGGGGKSRDKIVVGIETNGDTELDCHFLDPGDGSGLEEAFEYANDLSFPVEIAIRPGLIQLTNLSTSHLQFENGGTLTGSGQSSTVILTHSGDSGNVQAFARFGADTLVRDLTIVVPSPTADAASGAAIVEYTTGCRFERVAVIVNGSPINESKTPVVFGTYTDTVWPSGVEFAHVNLTYVGDFPPTVYHKPFSFSNPGNLAIQNADAIPPKFTHVSCTAPVTARIETLIDSSNVYEIVLDTVTSVNAGLLRIRGGGTLTQEVRGPRIVNSLCDVRELTGMIEVFAFEFQAQAVGVIHGIDVDGLRFLSGDGNIMSGSRAVKVWPNKISTSTTELRNVRIAGVVEHHGDNDTGGIQIDSEYGSRIRGLSILSCSARAESGESGETPAGRLSLSTTATGTIKDVLLDQTSYRSGFLTGESITRCGFGNVAWGTGGLSNESTVITVPGGVNSVTFTNVMNTAILDEDFAGTATGALRRTGTGAYAVRKDNTSTADPTSAANFAAGYSVGSHWVNTTGGTSWTCTGDGVWTSGSAAPRFRVPALMGVDVPATVGGVEYRVGNFVFDPQDTDVVVFQGFVITAATSVTLRLYEMSTTGVPTLRATLTWVPTAYTATTMALAVTSSPGTNVGHISNASRLYEVRAVADANNQITVASCGLQVGS